MLVGCNTYKEPAGGMWGILNKDEEIVEDMPTLPPLVGTGTGEGVSDPVNGETIVALAPIKRTM